MAGGEGKSRPRRLVVGALIGLGTLATVVGVAGTIGDWGSETTVKTASAVEPSPAPDQGPETPEEFLAALAEAARTGDTGFRVERLHPVVIERYGSAACRANLSTADPTRAFVVQSVRSKREAFDYSSDGQSVTIPATVVVDVQSTMNGQTSPTSVHIKKVDGRFTYFVDCGTPATG